ncbi:hypothetical protein [Myroides odoratus]|uniref:Uncharacterized protein n=1 Tax=Myroides odoratus TaxID=256 RepID=A0A9Q7E7Q2_MYROD|nr:hypothetical protein [Myroides odoratus]EHQ41709.1 hypothetical protein Myrod_0873 [Myroides odoratus DSM 2801]EKB08910.1 hypothetical protein HMPREF9716_00571 [Myroides odoratus CIP 103059]QQT99116.1 hypothetical protein I6I88_12950 [Myroides odoratus]WQD58691.1 hypothetical protein U0010_06015 [Myroides odoratus]STZ28968.1 Uncharacterised protein [Myroides odoratus]
MISKKEIINDWASNLVELTIYSSSRLLKIYEPFVLGIELFKVPGEEKYRPIFVCYPLWKKDIKKCFEEPVFMQEICNNKGLQFNVFYEKHRDFFREALICTKEQAPILDNKNVALGQLVEVVEKQFSEGIVKASPVGQVKLLEAQFIAAVYFNDIRLSEKTLDRIRKLIVTYDSKFLEWKYGKLDDWLTDLELIRVNREKLVYQIEINKQDKKIAKLKSALLLP